MSRRCGRWRALRVLAAVHLLAFPLVAAGGEAPKLTAEEYWYYEAMSLIVGAETVNGVVTGTVQGKEGPIPFSLTVEDLRAPSARTAGYVKAVRSMVSLVVHGESEKKREHGRSRLEALTGLRLATPEEWLEWLRLNEGSLAYSEETGRLMIMPERRP